MMFRCCYAGNLTTSARCLPPSSFVFQLHLPLTSFPPLAPCQCMPYKEETPQLNYALRYKHDSRIPKSTPTEFPFPVIRGPKHSLELPSKHHVGEQENHHRRVKPPLESPLQPISQAILPSYTTAAYPLRQFILRDLLPPKLISPQRRRRSDIRARDAMAPSRIRRRQCAHVYGGVRSRRIKKSRRLSRMG